MKARVLRFIVLVPMILALVSLIKPLIPAGSTASQLFATPTTVGVVVLSITWFLYLSGYGYARLLMLFEGLASLGIAAVIFLGYFLQFNYPGKDLVVSSNKTFLINLTTLFLVAYLIQVIAYWLPRMKAKFLINAALAAILFMVLLSLFGRIYAFNGIPQNTLLTPMPLGDISSFFIWGMVVFAYTNRMQRLYLTWRIIISFVTMFVAIISANAVIYHNISETAQASTKIGVTETGLFETYNFNFYIGSAQSRAQAYELVSSPKDAAAYRADKASYLQTIGALQTLVAQNDTPSDVRQSVATVAGLGAQVLKLGDGIISGKSPTMAQIGDTAVDRSMNSYMGQILTQVKFLTTSYTQRLNQQAPQELSGASGIILGISITSAFSILLFLFTPLFIRQTIHNLSRARDELKRSSELFAEEKTRAEAVLASISDGLFAVDAEGVITLFNHTAEEITGVRRMSALGKLYTDVLHFDTTLDFTSKALHGVTSHLSHNAVLQRSDGKAVDVQVSASPVLNRASTVTGAIVVFRDRSSEQALENAKDDFVSLASHQLRTPATATKQFLAMFLEGYAGEIDDRQRLFLQQAYDNNEIGIQIIEALLNITRLESNKFEVMKEKIELNDFLEQSVAQHDVLARKSGQSVKLVAPAKHIFIEADTNLLTMAVDNLITNALKYSHDGDTVTVRLSDGHQAKVAIVDHGIGIKHEDIPKLFRRFSRLQDPQKEYVGGTGIGLYVVKQIAQKLHATIKVESVYGKGSTFELVFKATE